MYTRGELEEIQAGVFTPTPVRTTFDGTTVGAVGTISLFTVAEDGLVAVMGDCSVDLTGNTATLSVGITGNTAALVPVTTATTLDATLRLDKSGLLSTSALPDVTPFFPVHAGDVIKITVATAAITAGVVDWYLYYGSFDTTKSSVATPTSVGDGLKLVTTAGTRETLAGSTACRSVVITAKQTNTGTVVVGGSTVIAASGATRRGTPLQAGDSISMDLDNLSKIYVDVTVNGEGVTYTYTR